MRWRWLSVMMFLGLVGCGTFADHVVRKGETLYSISWRYGYDYREVAAWNDIPPPYIIREGQRLRLTPPPDRRKIPAAPNGGNQPRRAPAKRPETGPAAPVVEKTGPAVTAPAQPPRKLTWVWPAEGSILTRFSPGKPGRKGIDIGGRLGDPVKAAAAGRVVYSGKGIPRYGNLLIIKHNDKFLSAYAHNRRLLVEEGAWVAKGQKIAEMGRSGTGVTQVMLHFEIRVDGKPVDPMAYLPAKKKVTSRGGDD